MWRLAVMPVLALFALWGGTRGDASTPVPIPFLYTAARQYVPDAWMQTAERFPSGAEVFIHDASGDHPLAPDFAETADPASSFDGQHILFSGRRNQRDPWTIWEFSLTDKIVRQVITCPDDCIRPFYLPEDRVVYARKLHERFVLESDTLDKSDRLQLTYSPGNSLPLDVLRDGRILFESTYPLGSKTTAELYTIYSDGSGVEAYRCDHGPSRRAGKQVASGDIVLVSGQGLARFTAPLAHESKINAPSGEYAGDVLELPNGNWVLPWRTDASGPYQIVMWTPGSIRVGPVLARRGTSLLQPVALAPRFVPNRHPSGLHDWSYANLLCLNAYTSKHKFAPTSIASARLYTQDELGHPRLLGEAPVEKDGSFYVRTAADQPLQLELLDKSGKSVHKENGWFWLRRGEQRICVGCHAGPETAPENVVPQILLRSTTPADLTGKPAQLAAGGR